MPATLGMATMICLPFCFFNLISVLVSFIYVIIGLRIKRLAPEQSRKEAPEEATCRAIGGRRVEPAEHETAVRGG